MMTWSHTDSRGVQTSIAQAIDRAKRRAWLVDPDPTSTGTRVADLRALAVGTIAALAWAFTVSATQAASNALSLLFGSNPLDGLDPQRRRVALALLRTWYLLAGPAPSAFTTPNRTIKTDGDGSPSSDAGNPVAIALVVVAGVVVLGVVCWAIYRSTWVVDEQLKRRGNARRLAEAQARMLEILDQHRQAERVAGKSLPLSPAELRGLDALEATQRAFSEPDRAAPGFPDPGAPAGFGFGLIVAVAAAAAAYVVFFRRS